MLLFTLTLLQQFGKSSGSNMPRMCSMSVVFIVIFLQLLVIFDQTTGFSQKPLNASNRIVNGRDARIEDFPFQISLRRSTVHICGASVLDTNWAITAAHCIHGLETMPELFTLRIGSSLRAIGGEVISISAIYLHPMYNADTMNFDVALLRTKPNLLRGDFVKPIRLPDVSAPIKDNTAAIISGWGHMSSSEHVLSTVLKYAIVYTVKQEECDMDLKYQGGITDAMFCAAARNTDACQGDSGGPIQVNETLIGLVSWGVGCADPHYPGVYTRLAHPSIRLWIRLWTRL